MGKISLGFLIGVATTGFVLFILKAHDPSASQTDSSASGSTEASPNTLRNAPQSSESDERSRAPTSGGSNDDVTVSNTTSESGRGTADGGATLEDLRSLRAEADAAREAWQQAEGIYTRTLAAIPVQQPVQLPPEFDWLDERGTVYHALFEREPVDPDWAPVTESQVLGFFGKQPELIEKYGYPTVRCRKTHCEAEFIAYNANESQTMTIMRWDGYVADIVDEPWGEQFESPSPFGNPANQYAEIHEEDGVTTILWHLWSTRD